MTAASHVTPEPDRDTTRVFICDDQADVLVALHEAVESVPGFRVVGTAGDGDGCLRGLRRHRPDLLVQDVSMPGGGPELTASVRAEHPALVIVAYSAHADPALRRALREAGADDYVVKTGRLAPLREALLRHKVPDQ
ncbi:response regulator [Phycicoccus sonneratiae]|uniref:Response regulator transcription factor n=1 Tax=Phycicoccus sonneratiae TaxID=2807628 RepID=A0ABS2CRV5_9MICO|nr:response regulator transcription factor [Phycicoccus sonneraticus]MBM6402533.1 response regulator transcription factor [Phycicoccus sonneraticus]